VNRISGRWWHNRAGNKLISSFSLCALVLTALLASTANAVENGSSALGGMKVVAAAICILPLAGCALGIGMVFCGMLYGVSRNPMSYDTVFGLSLLGLAMIELFGFICIFGAAAIAMS